MPIELGLEGKVAAITGGSEGLGRAIAERLSRAFARRRGIPVGRVAEASELADLVAYLVSERASYITGTTIAVDGGFCRSLL